MTIRKKVSTRRWKARYRLGRSVPKSAAFYDPRLRKFFLKERNEGRMDPSPFTTVFSLRLDLVRYPLRHTQLPDRSLISYEFPDYWPW